MVAQLEPLNAVEPDGRVDSGGGASLPPAPTTSKGGIPSSAARHLLTGTSALGAGMVIERGFGFLANILAARIGGASMFGAYSLAIATANNIGTYTAGGIGSTATRFSGKYPRGSAGYSTLARVLVIVSLVSAIVAATGLWWGSAPLAGLLHKPSLTGLLHWAAISAAGMIVLECLRGFLVGQRRLAGLVVLSMGVGLGMITLLPLTAHISPVAMICSQGLATIAAVLLCLALFRPLGLSSPVRVAAKPPVGPILREVWSFSLVQLAGFVGMNAAGWWLTSLVARADTSMKQMGFLAVANQVRNMVALVPGLLSQSSLALMAEGDDAEKTPDHVMAVCTLAATFTSLLLAGIGILIVPWGITLLYGRSFAAASSVTALALATAVIHMGNAPASGRLAIVTLKAAGIINTVWAVLVAASATVFLFNGGSAVKAAAITLAAHCLSAGLVLYALRKRGSAPRGIIALFSIGAGASVATALLSVARDLQPQLALPLSIAIVVVFCAGLGAMLLIGRRHGWVPSWHSIRHLLAGGPALLARLRPSLNRASNPDSANTGGAQ